MTELNYLLFFEDIGRNLKSLCAARLVSSQQEATKIHNMNHVDKPIENRYNKFSIVWYYLSKYHGTFDYNVYLNLKDREVYLFLDNISCQALMPYKYVPEISWTVKLDNFNKNIQELFDTDFIDKIKEYYKDTELGPDNNNDKNFRMAYLNDGDIFGISELSKFKKIEYHRISFNTLDLRKDLENSCDSNQYIDSTINLSSLTMLHNANDEFIYVTDGTYLWSVKRNFFDDYQEYKQAFKGKEGYECYYTELET